MRQTDLNRAVARATGETVSMVKSLGFSIEEPLFDVEPSDSTETGPNVVDWDSLQARRRSPYPWRFCREPTCA
jgi:hypothetical protein